MTLGGLAVAVGRVVDDAIVVLENIYRHRALGEDRLTASSSRPARGRPRDHREHAHDGCRLPALGFVGGIVSQLFLPFALTVTFALLASLVVALTVVPVLAYLFINRCRSTSTRTASRRTRSGSGPTRPRSSSPCATAGRSGACCRRPRPRCSSARWDRPAAADAVHQRRLREDPPGHRRAARRHELRGRPRAGRSGRGDPARRRARSRSSRPASRARATRASDDPVTPRSSGQPANSATLTVRLEDGRPDEETVRLSEAPRADQGRRLRRERGPDRRVHVEQPQHRRQRSRHRRASRRWTDAVLAALADNGRTSSTSVRPRPRARPRSRSSSTRTRRSA
jgi:hypothetical protein